MGWWMPLTWVSFALDYQIWALDPLGYHLTNILLHAANTSLVVLIANRILICAAGRDLMEQYSGSAIPGSEAGIAASYLYAATAVLSGLLWGLHPLRVESVAWVTERKDVLNGLFSLGSLFCYLVFVEVKDRDGYSFQAFCYSTLSTLLLLFSLMAKPVSVVIPFMLLVADWYPLNRIRRGRLIPVLVEKIPFFVLVAGFALGTLMFASENKILVSFGDLSLYNRFLLAGNSLFEYCKLTLYPADIINIYLLPWPYPSSYGIKTLVIVVFSCFCLWNYKKRPWLPVAWLLFVLPLAPVLGFFQNGAQSHAARFTYLPAVAPSIVFAVMCAVLYSRITITGVRWSRNLFIGAILLLLLTYGAVTVRLINTWKNPETLWSRVIAIQPIGRAFYLRADYYAQKGRFEEAAADLQTSIQMGQAAGFSGMYNLHALRGYALGKAGRYKESAEEFTRAILLKPHPSYYYHRGHALQILGRISESQEDFAKANGDTGPIEWQK
jgi:hypothetical protein